MRVVILGGTFNPVHIGHLFLGYELLDQFNFDKVLYVPTNVPTHKTIEGSVTVHDRIAMLEKALEGNDRFKLETCDIDRGGVSYSIDTIACIKSKYNLSDKPSLVIGDDLFETFNTWKDAQKLATEAHLYVAHRLYKEHLEYTYKHTYINNKIFPLSSSEIRARVQNNLSIKYLVPEAVEQYILQNKLYANERPII